MRACPACAVVMGGLVGLAIVALLLAGGAEAVQFVYYVVVL